MKNKITFPLIAILVISLSLATCSSDGKEDPVEESLGSSLIINGAQVFTSFDGSTLVALDNTYLQTGLDLVKYFELGAAPENFLYSSFSSPKVELTINGKLNIKLGTPYAIACPKISDIWSSAWPAIEIANPGIDGNTRLFSIAGFFSEKVVTYNLFTKKAIDMMTSPPDPTDKDNPGISRGLIYSPPFVLYIWVDKALKLNYISTTIIEDQTWNLDLKAGWNTVILTESAGHIDYISGTPEGINWFFGNL